MILRLIVLLIQISAVQTISCYQCVDCGDPFNINSPNVTRSPSSCYYCYKLTVSMAYVPVNYVIKECVQSCIESSGYWGGSSLEVKCCTSSLCNHAFARFHSWSWTERVFSFFISYLLIKLI